ncbi:MAG TPA: hypothetical protein VMW16_17150 [Sedimentisphaerales bacterium]|nr:hypothetical protein [Sedimentisphaerales bacterium]
MTQTLENVLVRIEPKRIGEILPSVILDIERRIERADSQRKSRIIKATKDFLSGRKRGRGINRESGIANKQRKLFEI